MTTPDGYELFLLDDSSCSPDPLTREVGAADDMPPLTWDRVWELYQAEAARIPDPRVYWEYGGALYSTGPAEP